jgi:hypothetical protein
MNNLKRKGRDSKNCGIRITGLGVMVEKIWKKEALGAKLVFWKVPEVYL